MKKSEAKDCDSLVLQALEMTLVCGRPVKLVAEKKSDASGVFPDETGERRKAIERCLDGAHPLLEVVKTDKDPGDSQAGNRWVVITSGGIKYLFSHTPLEQASELIQEATLKANSELREIDALLQSLVMARQRVMENVTALLEQFQRTTDDAVLLRSHVQDKDCLLKGWLERLPLPPALAPKSQSRPPLREPATEEENLFRQRTAQELVFAWQDADNSTRTSIERVLFNLGAEAIGTSGERSEFSGRLHICDESAFPGDTVEIMQPGWLLADTHGGYLLAHAKVSLIPDSKE